jgi:hypothetical protein
MWIGEVYILLFSLQGSIPGISPSGVDAFLGIMSDACLKCSIRKCLTLAQNNVTCEGSGTSYSSPILAGIAADLMTANWDFMYNPTLVRAALLLTAQNVDYSYWNYLEDGRDGAGVVSGSDAVAFARSFEYAWTPETPIETGLFQNLIFSYDTVGLIRSFNVKIPDVIPTGKHLRAVLTWSSSPSENAEINDICDLDLGFIANNDNPYGSMSYDDNIEIVDIENNVITAGGEYPLTVNLTANRISQDAYSSYIYYAIAWTWVKDHAE